MIEAVFDPAKNEAASVKGATQYDTGQRLLMHGLPGPEELAEMDELLSGEGVTVQVQYAYKGDVQSEPRIAAWDEARGGWLADVPNAYLTKHEPVYAYVYVDYGAAEDASRAKTMYTAAFTPKSRPAPTDQVTEDQLNAWDVLVGEVNLAIAGANEAASGANAAATLAQKWGDATVSATTLEAGSEASVTVTEKDGVKHIDYGIPRGAQGPEGPQGPTGPTGPAGVTFRLEGTTLYIDTDG